MLHLTWYLACGMLLHLIFSKSANGEFYSSVDSLQDLAKVEEYLINATHLYLEAQQEKLDIYRRFVEQIKQEQEQARFLNNLDDYLGHPLHSFRFLKRLTYDWDWLVFGPIVDNKPKEEFENSVHGLIENWGYPNSSEVQGVVKGVARLQKVYNLTASDLADGIINGLLYETQLDWRDCYEIGVQLFEIGDYLTSEEWLEEALVLIEENLEQEHGAVYKSDIREYLELVNFELGYTKRSKSLLNESSAQLTLKFLENSKRKEILAQDDFPWFANYSRLCQGNRLLEKNDNILNCYLDGERQAFFILAPLKVEQVHLDPEINVYHGLLSTQQISSIFAESNKKERIRSGVAGENGEDRTVKDIRVSQQTWLNYSTPIMKYVSRINEYISGLTMQGAEEMQVANYGVGGQYEPHPDYFEFNLPSDFEGDRISTSMFYVSNKYTF
ncbi:hypothetical protein KR026_003420 [Drosophila bipectinata]|nr:hypothetical protein KR026_003420 [Drosophila bipectinata]